MIPITDTHQHLVYPDKFPYSWTDGIPALQGKAFRLDDYEKLSTGTGIDRTIFMETSPDDPHHFDEASWVYELAAQPGSRIAGVIASARPEEPEGFAAMLEKLAHPKLVGIRRILHVVPDEMSSTPHFVSNVRQLANHGLTFDMCFLARQLPLAKALAQQCENVQFVLDHCGVPDVTGQALDPWRDDIRALAALPNVACKISGVMAYAAPEQANAAAVRPFVEHCIESFGWDRVVWGSDWPVCNMTTCLADWVAVSREIVAGCSHEEQEKLFHRNASRIYGLR